MSEFHENYELHKRSKIFNDSIHGSIELGPCLIKIIDTPQFQRLRHIKQLGAGYYVYPGACHNRFEHSIGVAHLAGEFVRALKSRQPELKITDVEVLCVEIAGLCHDLGHGPFSHVFDSIFIPKMVPDSTWEHEDASVAMLEELINKNELRPFLEKYGVKEDDIKFIIDIIKPPKTGEPTMLGKDKHFLYEIVANKSNGIDVDKWDYFARDCHHLGIRNSFDHLRFMKFARVIKDVDTGETRICSRDKEVEILYEMFHVRDNLHRRAYQHKTTKIIEYMLTEALILADPHLLFKGKDGKMLRMSEGMDDMEAYVKMTNHVAMQIKLSDMKELDAAKEILERIEKRQLYKHVGYARIEDSATRPTLTDLPNADDCIVLNFTVDYGSNTDNPINNVMFYSKDNPDVLFPIVQDDVSRMLPTLFSEKYARGYSKQTDPDSLKKAKTCFMKWCDENDFKPIIYFSSGLERKLVK